MKGCYEEGAFEYPYSRQGAAYDFGSRKISVDGDEGHGEDLNSRAVPDTAKTILGRTNIKSLAGKLSTNQFCSTGV